MADADDNEVAKDVASDILRANSQGTYVRDEPGKPMQRMQPPFDPSNIGKDNGGYASLPRNVARDRAEQIEKGRGIASSSVRNIQEEKLPSSEGTLGDAIEAGLKARHAHYAADRGDKASPAKADAVQDTLKKIADLKNETKQSEKDKKAAVLGRDSIYQAEVARTGAAVTTVEEQKIPVHEHATPTMRNMAAGKRHAGLAPNQPVPGVQGTVQVLQS